MRYGIGPVLLCILAACPTPPTTTSIQWGRYDPEAGCWMWETVIVDVEDFPEWTDCYAGGFGVAVNLDGECVRFDPLCGSLDVPGLQPCDLVEGCCDLTLPVTNPSDPVCQ